MIREDAVQERLEKFLRSGECVCPFTVSAILHFSTSNDKSWLERTVRKFTKTEGRNPSHALIVFSPRSVEDVEEWAIRTFLELYAAFWVAGGQPRAAVEQN